MRSSGWCEYVSQMKLLVCFWVQCWRRCEFYGDFICESLAESTWRGRGVGEEVPAMTDQMRCDRQNVSWREVLTASEFASFWFRQTVRVRSKRFFPPTLAPQSWTHITPAFSFLFTNCISWHLGRRVGRENWLPGLLCKFISHDPRENLKNVREEMGEFFWLADLILCVHSSSRRMT